MADHFRSLRQAGPWYASYLSSIARPDQISQPVNHDYISFHVRLGDFARPNTETQSLATNNTGTPIAWYAKVLATLRLKFPETPILISSDGSDEELRELLVVPGVKRTSAKNALDEMFIMSRSCGIVGSRSTFSSWGAFLGEVPLFLFPGGNAYPPHSQTWEDTSNASRGSWMAALEQGLLCERTDVKYGPIAND